MYSTKKNVLQLISLLKAHNISKFVVSPGSRHIPIVISMECDPFFKLYSVVDERSASFFALGLIQKNNESVGIICTSGTASANYCSAISEAYYQHLPLLVITADRLPCYLDQQEDQMIHQSTEYTNVAKWVANLPDIHTSDDEWYCNRLINEALLELRHRGDGPVQINIPIKDHLDDFSTEKLPKCRKISRVDLSFSQDYWNDLANKIKSKKIIVVIGEGFPLNPVQQSALNQFLTAFDAIVLADKMSNCHHEHTIENSFPVLNALAGRDVTDMAPELVITCRANYSFNPEFKGFIKRVGHCVEHWYVSSSGFIVDPFASLSTVFEMNEFDFFLRLAQCAPNNKQNSEYANIWKVISESIEEPNVEYSHLAAVKEFMSHLPNDCYLHLSNSNSVRMAQLFHIDSSVEIHCNRGTDGIDGCMSTAVGFASDTDKPVFLMIGDLTFFYDMNALWNRQLGKNLRIMLNNNNGGAIMHMPSRPNTAAALLPNYISAQHQTSAKAWVEDRGFIYLSATNTEELKKEVEKLTDLTIEGPIILEVFTEMLNDTAIFKSYYASINREKLDKSLKKQSKEFVKKVFEILGLKETVKSVMGKIVK